MHKEVTNTKDNLMNTINAVLEIFIPNPDIPL
jgi:hypothetical protein